jgi:L-threonylcarbamoyladenylate synthase
MPESVMKPLVISIDPSNIEAGKIGMAADVVKRGGLVAFPTETVYGLGANALDARAVAGIFKAKKRPLDDPLIVHIAQISDLGRLAAAVPEKALKLIDRFWPGPLTLVLEKTSLVPDIVTTGLGTVAIRMPSGRIALELIRSSQTPIAAPSANLFGRTSPTSAGHVISDLGDHIDMVIDGGETDIGVESTVVAFSGDEVSVLRPGGINIEDIGSVVGKLTAYGADMSSPECPGKYPKHYAPEARVIVADMGGSQTDEVKDIADTFKKRGQRPGIMCAEEHVPSYGGYDIKVLGPKGHPDVCASRLFRLFREFDAENYDVIIAESIEEKGLGFAVMNRIRKAAGCS